MGKLTLLNLGALANLAGTSLIAILATVFYVGKNRESSSTSQAPVFSQFVHNETISSDEVCFRDNFAPGMNAKMHYLRGTVDLARKSNGLDYAFFEIPKDARRYDGELEFVAIDSEGNRSERKKLYVNEGLIYENEPLGIKTLKNPSSQPKS